MRFRDRSPSHGRRELGDVVRRLEDIVIVVAVIAVAAAAAVAAVVLLLQLEVMVGLLRG